MPQVPRYTRQIGPAALPGARRTEAETSLSTGAELAAERARTAGTLAGAAAAIGEDAQRRVEAARQRADELAVLAAQNQYLTARNQFLHGDGETPGALARRGREVLDLPATAAQTHGALVGEIEQGLTTDRQRAAFQAFALRQSADFDLTVRRHTAAEIDAFERTELAKFVDNGVQEAITAALDPRRAVEALASVEAKIRQHGRLGPEATEAAVAAAYNRGYQGVIGRLIDAGEISTARGYFTAALKDGQITGETVAAIEEALGAGTQKQRAQAATDEIVAAGGTLTDQLTRARERFGPGGPEEDADLRDDVVNRLKIRGSERETAELQQQRDDSRDAYNILYEAGSIDAIPQALLSSLPGPVQAALRDEERQLARGVPREPDWGLWYVLRKEAETNPGAFARRDLYALRPRLGDRFESLANLQAATLGRALGGGQAGSAEVTRFRTKEQLFEETIGSTLGISVADALKDPKSSDYALVVQLRRNLDLALEALPDPSNTDIQRELDRLLIEGTTFQQGALGGETPRLVTVPAEDRAQITAGLQRIGQPATEAAIAAEYVRVRTTLQTIPGAIRTKVEGILRFEGVPVTDAAIVARYLAMLDAGAVPGRRGGGGGR